MIELDKYRKSFEDAMDFFHNDTASLRTGRATPALIENISVEVYGAKSPLVQLASITTPDPRTLTVQPWDKNLLKDIERSISSSEFECSVTADKDVIRISMPPLTEENRQSIVKILFQKTEAARVSVRQLREKIRNDIGNAEEAGDISEDEKFKAQKLLDETVKEYNDKIKTITDKKEIEIMTI